MTTFLDTVSAGPSASEPIDDGFTLDFPGMMPGADYTVKLVLAEVRARNHRDTLFSVAANGETALRHGAIVNSVDPGDGMAHTSFVTSADDAGAVHLTFSSAFDRRHIRGVEILSGRRTPPGSPTGISAVVGSGRIIVCWDEVPGASSYIVKRRGGGAHHMSPVASGLTTCTYTDPMVAPDVTYSYQVIAVGSMGEGSPSLAVDAVPAIALEAQPPIVHLAAGAGSCLLVASIQPGIEGVLQFAVGGMRDGLMAELDPPSILVSAADATRGTLVTCLKLAASATTGQGIQNLIVRARIDQYSDALSLTARIV